MTSNYIDVSHEYYGLPDDDGLRAKRTDVWYAIRPTAPQISVVDHKSDPLPGHEVRITTAWMLGKAGLEVPYIYDRDDIAGLRRLLDAIELNMDREDMEELHRSLDNEENDQ